MNVLAPARPETPGAVQAPFEPKLERGPAYGQVDGPEAAADDWPAFRHDSARSGASAVEGPAGAALAWRVKLGESVSAPIAVGQHVFASLVTSTTWYASMQGTVRSSGSMPRADASIRPPPGGADR